MGIGKITDNYTFYNGYEGEPKVIISLSNTCNIHIWEGYFDDIFDNPTLDGKGWQGFTRDYHQIEGIFANSDLPTKLDAVEYLKDLESYREKSFDFDESIQVLELLISLFNKAIKMDINIFAERK